MSPLVGKVNNKRKAKRTQKVVQKRKKLGLKNQQAISASKIDRFDIVGNLPPELVQTIFSHLNPLDLRNALRTCRKWRSLARDDYFWKHRCKVDNYLELKETVRSKLYETFVQGSENYWEKVYVYNEALHQNWQNYEFKETVFDFPTGRPRIHHFDDEVVIMTNDTKRIFVYNYYAEKFIHVLHIPINGIVPYMISKTLNYIVYADRMARLLIVWCNSTGLCHLNVNLPHENGSGIRDIVINKNLVAFLYFGYSCRILNILSGKVEHKTEITELNNCVCFHEDQVVFGTCNGVINVMNWAHKVITTTLIHGEEIVIFRIMISGDHLISFSEKDICVWSLQSKAKLYFIVQTDHLKNNLDAVFSNHRTILIEKMVQGSKKLEAWDFVDGVCKFDIGLESYHLRIPIRTNDHYIFTYCPRRWKNGNIRNARMKTWCKKTGKFLSDVRLNYNFTNPLVTNTKVTYLNITYANNCHSSMHIKDFEKKIKLKQLNSLYE